MIPFIIMIEIVKLFMNKPYFTKREIIHDSTL